MSEIKAASNEPTVLNPIRVETALSRHPIHRLARKGNIDICIREGDAESVQTQWEVDYSKKHGQPGPLAYKLDTLIINRRIEEETKKKGRLKRLLRLGSLSEICRELDLADGGKNRADIKRSLYQNAFAGITAKTTYKLESGGERTLEAGFTRYSVILTGEELPDGHKADAVYVILNDVFLQVINGAKTRPLNYDYLKSLSPAPQRFYELLSYQMYAALKYDLPRAKLVYSDFCARAPQTRHVDWNRVRSQMHKVHRPHRESGYIMDVKFNETTDGDGRPDWVMLYQPGPKARSEFIAFNERGGQSVVQIEPFDAPMPLLPTCNPLEQALTRHGISGSSARDLVTRHSSERIEFQIECMEWLLDKHPEKIDEPAAYLFSAIEKDYAPPKRFVTKAERQRRAAEKQARDQEVAEKKRIAQEHDDRVKAERLAVNAYRKALTAEQLSQIEADAVAQADEALRTSLATTTDRDIRQFQLNVITDLHITRLLQQQLADA